MNKLSAQIPCQQMATMVTIFWILENRKYALKVTSPRKYYI